MECPTIEAGNLARMSRLSVIRGKLRPPPRPEVFVPRGRISAIFKDLLESYRLITVVAAAGSGKTTAVAQAVAELDMPVAWLTLDDTDSASGRLVTYLEAAIASRSETVADVASAAMATGIPHPEAAGLLAEATSDHRFVMVIDEVDRLHDDVEALAVIEGFIRHLPRQSRVILVSRWEIKLNTQLGVAVSIGDRELAFSLDEAASLIEGYGSQDISPEQVIEESDGWVTGAVYRVQGGAAYRLQDYGESDPLNGYLASQDRKSVV